MASGYLQTSGDHGAPVLELSPRPNGERAGVTDPFARRWLDLPHGCRSLPRAARVRARTRGVPPKLGDSEDLEMMSLTFRTLRG